MNVNVFIVLIVYIIQVYCSRIYMSLGFMQMSVHIIIYNSLCTHINFILDTLPDILPKHYGIITHHVDDPPRYLFYLKQYLFIHSVMNKHGHIYYGMCDMMDNIAIFYKRWMKFGYDPNISYYKNLMYLLYDRQSIYDDSFMDLRDLNVNVIRDCIVDFLEPKVIFKLCLLSKEYYTILYERLITLKDGDLKPRLGGVMSYSNGYIPGDISVDHYNIKVHYGTSKVNGVTMVLEDFIPYPINPKEDGELKRYLNAIYSYNMHSSLVEYAMRGYWTDETRSWIQELYIPDMYIVDYGSLYTNKIDILGMRSMLTIDGDLIVDDDMLITKHGIFYVYRTSITVLSGMSIYRINAYMNDKKKIPLDDIDEIEGKYLGDNKWLMTDIKRSFSYVITYENDIVIGLDIEQI